MAKKKKLRANFRKNRAPRTRDADWTQRFAQDPHADASAARDERISGKGELTKKRIVMGEVADDGETPLLDVDLKNCLAGRVISVFGLASAVETDDGTIYRCATRRILKTLSTDERHVVAAGDRVMFRPAEDNEGIIERVEPRYGVVSRESRGRQHVLVANVDQLIILGSVAEPYLKPNLIDRYLVCAEQAGIRPIIGLNKIDLIDPAAIQPLVGVYSQMGYRVILLSAKTGQGIDRLRKLLQGRQSVISGQSGVGKSSILNSIEPGMQLRVGAVSQESQKGKHTTTTAQLLKLSFGGYVVDTPGIRQFQPWDVVPAEIAGCYRDLRPYVARCRFPDCTHRHEEACAVKDAVADGWLDVRRYESYVHLYEGLPD